MAEQVQARTKRHQFGYSLSVLSDVGKRRSENQDAYGYAVSSQAALFLVCDGMGGARGGATASALAIAHILNNAFTRDNQVDIESLRTSIAGSNSLIFGRSQEDPNLFGMGTTVAGILITENSAVLAHVGDSRVYMFFDGELRQLTRDHTLVQELVDTGTIAESEAASHPIAHMLTRSLGPTEIIGVEAKPLETPLRGGERFLICSDGLYNHVSFAKIKELLSNGTPESIAKSLVNHALDGGGSDNITALVLEIRKDVNAPGLLEIPPEGEVARVVSREAPALDAEGPADFSHWGASAGTGNGSHETTGYLKADELFAYAQQHQEKIAASGAAKSAEPEAPPPRSMMAKPFAAAVLFFGVLAGVLFVGKGGNKDPDSLVLHDPTPQATRAVISSSVNSSSGNQSSGHSTTSATGHPTAATSASEMPSLVPTAMPTAVSILEDTPVPTISAASTSVATQAPTRVPTSEATTAVATQTPGKSILDDPNLSSTAVPTAERAATAQPSGSIPAATPTPLSTSTPVPTPTPTLEMVEEKLSHVSDPDVQPKGIPAELIIKAFAMDIPGPPRLEDGELGKVPELAANSQIVWEHESQRMARILAESRAKRVNDAPESRDRNAPHPKIFSQKEIADAAKEKDGLRRRIAEIDGKISFLLIDQKADAKKKGKEFDTRIVALKKEIQQKKAEIGKWEQALSAWQFVKDQSISADTVKLAMTAEKFSPSIKVAREAFQKASDTYTSSLGRWKNQALDTEATATLAQLGREAKAKRLELENSVRREVERGWHEANEQVAQNRIELSGFEREKDLLVKYSGYANGFAPVLGTSRVDLYRKYLSERAKLMRRLKDLQEVLDDDAELTYRVQEVVAPNSPQT